MCKCPLLIKPCDGPTAFGCFIGYAGALKLAVVELTGNLPSRRSGVFEVDLCCAWVEGDCLQDALGTLN
jgi:hypothetical protein